MKNKYIPAVLFLGVLCSSCSISVASVQKALKGDENPYYYYVACKYEKKSRNLERAYQYCKKALKLLPDTSLLYRETITIALHMGKNEEALELLKKYKKKFKDSPDTYIFIAKV